MKDYMRCVKALDDNIGRVLDELAAQGLDDNTVVIYASDQGFYNGEHGWFDKRWMYEESLSMPLIVRWPGVVKPGRRFSPMVQNIDYAPTFVGNLLVSTLRPVPGDPVQRLIRAIMLTRGR